VAAKIRITLVKSGIGYGRDQKSTLHTLGLRKLNQSVIREDSLTLRGQILKVRHLVKVEEENDAAE
jgi:large subunit ribosomal protein L30